VLKVCRTPGPTACLCNKEVAYHLIPKCTTITKYIWKWLCMHVMVMCEPQWHRASYLDKLRSTFPMKVLSTPAAIMYTGWQSDELITGLYFFSYQAQGLQAWVTDVCCNYMHSWNFSSLVPHWYSCINSSSMTSESISVSRNGGTFP